MVAVIAALLVALGWTGSTAAEAPGNDSTDGCSGSWIRQFGVDVLILDCQPGYATQHDRAYMFPRGPVDTSADWRSQLNFDNAVWLFDAGATGNRASLIIDFHHDGAAAVAELFDDTTGDGQVRYGYERGYPRSIDSRFPTVRVTAPDGWWVRAGKVNYNLKIEVDGPTLASWAGELFRDFAVQDGRPDVTIRVHDPSGEGRPRWEIFQATPPMPESSAILRTGVMFNQADDELPVTTYILWPYLGYKGPQLPAPPPPFRPPLGSLPGAGYGIVKDYNSSFPPIQVDWQASRIDTIGEFVASRGRPHNWFIYSTMRFGENGQTVANFENPFAFYDLAGKNDGYPDLIIRDAFTAFGDPHADSLVPGPTHSIRYSWDQEHDKSLSYKLALMGQRPMPAVVDLGDAVKVQTVPYAEYPHWVVDNTWSTGAFVASERPGFWTTEGIYGWCAGCGDEQDRYYAGITTTKPTSYYSSIDEGFRGEYAGRLNEPVRLYLSPIDRKLHMLHAETGVWNVKDGLSMRYAALGGPYINRWQQVTDGVVTQSLYYLGDKLLFANGDGVQLARAPEAPAVFLARPPADPDSWRFLRDQLGDVKPLADATDLFEAFDQFKQDRASLPDVKVWDVRPTGDGFTLNALIPGPLADVPWTEGLQSGVYVVTYTQASGFAARPSRPGRLSISAPLVRGDRPTEFSPMRIRVGISNDGDTDLLSVPIAFLAVRSDQASQLIGTSTVHVAAGARTTAEIEWPLPAGGDWELSAVALGKDATTSDRSPIHVASAPPGDVGSLLLAQGLRAPSMAAIGASVLLAVAIAVGFGTIVLPAGEASTKRDQRG